MNNKQQQTTIYYEAPRPVNLGDVFYTIREGDWQTFHEPCKVCNGKRELTVNGVTFRCPCCNNQKETIRICKYVVRRFRVNAIEQRAGASDWKADDTRRVSFELYHKSGRGYRGDEYYLKEISDRDFSRYLNYPYNEENTVGSYLNAIYDDYDLAVSVADKLTEKELERLAAYNAEYGTDHAPTFKSEHNPKSK